MHLEEVFCFSSKLSWHTIATLMKYFVNFANTEPILGKDSFLTKYQGVAFQSLKKR